MRLLSKLDFEACLLESKLYFKVFLYISWHHPPQNMVGYAPSESYDCANTGWEQASDFRPTQTTPTSSGQDLSMLLSLLHRNRTHSDFGLDFRFPDQPYNCRNSQCDSLHVQPQRLLR